MARTSAELKGEIRSHQLEGQRDYDPYVDFLIVIYKRVQKEIQKFERESSGYDDNQQGGLGLTSQIIEDIDKRQYVDIDNMSIADLRELRRHIEEKFTANEMSALMEGDYYLSLPTDKNDIIEKAKGYFKRLRPFVQISNEYATRLNFTDEEIELLHSLSFASIFAKEVEMIKKRYQRAIHRLQKIGQEKETGTMHDRLRRRSIELLPLYHQKIRELDSIMDEMVKSDPLVWEQYYSGRLRDMARLAHLTGFVMTDTKRALLDKWYEEYLSVGDQVFTVALTGAPGMGKSFLARQLARQINPEKNPIIVTAHRNMQTDELLFQTVVEGSVAEKRNAILELLKQYNYEEDNPEFKILADLIINDASIRTRNDLVGVAKAASEGRVVIIDEWDTLPPATRLALNGFTSGTVGNQITVGGVNVTIQPGFAVIFTGNTGAAERQQIDVSERSRTPFETLLNKLDQSTNKLESQEGSGGRELFQIAVSQLLERDGTLLAPEGILDTLWRFSAAFRVLRGLKNGELLPGLGGIQNSYSFPTAPFDLRQFAEPILEWKRNNYFGSFDSYLWRWASVKYGENEHEFCQVIYVLNIFGGFFASAFDGGIDAYINTSEWRWKDTFSEHDLINQLRGSENPSTFIPEEDVITAMFGVSKPDGAETMRESIGREREMRIAEDLSPFDADELERLLTTLCPVDMGVATYG